MIRPMLPFREFRPLTVFQPRCLKVCAISVRGSAGTFARFSADLARARELFACTGIQLHQGGFMSVVDNTLLDLTGWTTSAVSDDARRLLAMGPACGRGERPDGLPTVYAYYVRTLGGGYNGIGRPSFANNAPGLVLSDAAGRYTFAHEIGHVLGLEHVANTETDNIMYFDSPNITVDPPNIREDQCRRARLSTIPVACTNRLELPPVQRPRIVRPLPFASTPALVGLLSDEPGVVERFAAMGQAILPQLLSRVSDPDPAVRVRVVSVLARIANPMAQQAVAMALESDANPSVRATAATALAEVRSPMAAPMLARSLTESDAGVRAVVLRALARLPEARMNLVQAAVREVDPAVRVLASRIAMGLP